MTSPHLPRLDLSTVTLACVDTRTPELALAAMQRCRAQIEFGDVLLFTDARTCVRPLPAGVRGVPVTIDSVPAYSEFMLRGMAAHLRTAHVLVVQWDGFVCNAAQWDPDFLRWDYIGALWPEWPGAAGVGNGGFSLRSKRLLDALHAPGMTVRHPEDLCICHDNRTRLERDHGIRFAPPELAARFAFERMAPSSPTFGFHGLFNFPEVMTPAELRDVVEQLPTAMFAGLDGRDLCRRLIERGQFATARLVLAQRRRGGIADSRTLKLRHRWALWRDRVFMNPADA